MVKISDYDYVLVGAGFFCAVVAERIANDLNKKVLIVEKRDHIGGNCYSEKNTETGIEFHKYGTHIFHTSNQEVWNYMNQFTSFNNYRHHVLTTYNDNVYPMPINLKTINSFYGINLRPFEVKGFLAEEIKKEAYEKPLNFEELAINSVGRPLYEAFIKGYTKKQWGRDPKKLPASIFKRIPSKDNYFNGYFTDTFQGIPSNGYTQVFNSLLASKNITVQLNTDFFDIKDQLTGNTQVIYSGPIDKLFDYKYGDLEYRTLRFENEVKPVADYQGIAVMNFANKEVTFTRIHEPKHLHPEKENGKNATLIMKEFSCEANREDPYYPIGGEKNRVLFEKYKEELKKHPNIITGGRLGDYRYYDMNHVIENALTLYKTRIKADA